MANRVEVLVIGGGSIGVCCAYFLAEKGRQVTVVDQGDVGAACSYGNAGVIARSHVVPLAAPGVLLEGTKWLFDPESPLYIKPRLDLDLLSWLLHFGMACRKAPMLRTMSLLRDLIQASLALYDEFASAGGPEFHFKHNGSLAIYKSSEGLAAGVKQAEIVRPYGVESRVLDQAAVRDLEPKVQPRIVGGIYFNADAHLNPSEFVQWLASRSRARGVTFLTSTEALRFGTGSSRISTVATTRGDFQADQIVLAAGSWSAGLAACLGLSLPVQPAKGYSITVKCQNRDDSIPVWLSESKVIATPMGGMLRFAGTLELAGLNFSINQRRVDVIRRAAREYLAGTDGYEILEIWRGFRPLTPDGLPIIEGPGRWNNLTIATGHGMQGIAMGPITGKLVAQLICKETPALDVAGLGLG